MSRSNMRTYLFISLVLGLSVGQFMSGQAQISVQPTADQLMQLMRSQPAVDISIPVAATAAFDPPLVEPGEKSIYRVSFNAPIASVNWPEKLPAPPSLEFHSSASGQNMLALNGTSPMFTTFVYDVHAAKAGDFIIPEFTVEVYGQPVVVPSARLEVKVGSPPHEPARRLVVAPSTTNAFIGEALNVTVRLPARQSGMVEGVSDLQLTGNGFVVDKNSVRQSFQMTGQNGRNEGAYIYEASITPITAGLLTLSAQGFANGVQFGGPRVINGRVSIVDSPRFTLLDSEPATINVRPVPVENQLPGFAGAVGSFTSDPPSLATNTLKVGEPVQLTVVIRGQKNFGRINPPVPPQAEDWQLFPAERGGIVPGTGMNPPGVSFKYTLIPLTDAVHETPSIPFSCFDPTLGRYVDLTIPPVAVTVLAGEASTNASLPAMISENITGEEQISSLSKLAPVPGWAAGSLVPLQLHSWFPLVQLLPALGFCGLYLLDRRRRFLEQHPEILRRRRARRALRRELRLLAKDAGDTGLFVQRAINALQIASAPHYPATPRALVCGDVLQILTATEREGKPGEIVRRFFAAADASAFAHSSEGRADLAAEKSDLKEILLKLEARL